MKTSTRSFRPESLWVAFFVALAALATERQEGIGWAQTPPASDPSLIAAYSFDGGTGTTLVDDSGKGHTGTISGATWVMAGHSGSALSFDGVNDLVTIADANDLDVTTGMTLEAWVNPTVLTNWRTIVMKEAGTDLSYALYGSNGSRPGAWVRVGPTSTSAIGTSALPANTWTHVAATYDAARLRFYINGVQVANVARTGSVVVSTSPLRVGGNSLWGEYFTGLIDDLRIYNRALGQTEIQADMGTPVPPPGPPRLVIAAPSSGASVPGPTIAVAYTASGALTSEVDHVHFRLDGGTEMMDPPPFDGSYSLSNVGPGPHTLDGFLVRADHTKINGTDAATITFTAVAPDTTPPSVALTAPIANATIAGTVTVSASASDNVGVAGVQFLLNGGALGAEDTSSPYSVSWTTSTNGPHTLTARARDLAGNVSVSSAVSVTVLNTSATLGLVAAYSFDGSTGTTLTDESGNGHHGAISGATWLANGHSGAALSFDGVNDMVTIADANGLDLTTGMTLEAWVNPTSTAGWRTILLKERPGDSIYSLYASDGSRPNAWALIGATQVSTFGSAPLPLNTWTHLSVTFDGATLRLYVNGVQASSAARTGSIAVSTDPLRLGGNSVWGEYYAGLIDDLRIYNRALSQAEIQSNMSTPVLPPGPPRLIITTPTSSSTVVGPTVNVTYTASGPLTPEIDHVHFRLDGGPELMDLPPFDGVFALSNVTPGTHTLDGFLVRADHTRIDGTDAAPVIFTAASQQDTVAPTVSLTAPLSGATISGTVLLSATANDDVGIAGVQFLADGAPLGSEDLTAPYSLNWTTNTIANGTHNLSARARDLAGNTTVSAAVAVTVSNTSGPSIVGQWSAPFSMPVVAINQVLLPTGKVLMWDAEDFTSAPPTVWDPLTSSFTNYPQSNTDLFCVGTAMLHDGRLLTVGGDTRTTGLGVNDVNQFDAFTGQWTALPKMTYKRWYPTAVTLADGRVFVMSGYGDCYNASCLQAVPEIFDPRTNTWSALPAASYKTPSYPFLFQLSDGRILNAGSYEGTIDTRVLDLNTNAWTIVDSRPIDAGSAVMYAPDKIMKAGKWANSDTPYVAAHANTYVMDASQPSPTWRTTASMHIPRAYHALTLLPDGTVLASGGSRNTDPGSQSESTLEPEIWSPQTETWTTMAPMRNGRLYHNSAVLLPDGRVLAAGSGRYGSLEQLNGEIFSPPYLFKGTRPVISSVPTVVQAGSTFTVATTNTNVSAITMIRTGSMTHSFNPDQRFFNLPFQPAAGGFTATAPSNINVATPGYYLVFLIGDQGVPSVGAFTKLSPAIPDTQAPSPPSSLTAVTNAGSVSLSWQPATDNVGVTRYNVHRATTPGFMPTSANRVGQPTTTGYMETNVPAGTYYYQVTAQDLAANVSAPSNEVTVTVSVDTTAPSSSLTGPVDGATISGAITVTASASDNVGVVGVQFLLDGAALGAEDTTAPYSVSWNTIGADGPHTLAARARDAAGNITTSTAINVSVNNADATPPVTAVTSPANGASVLGTITLTASASDNIGVVGVQFLLDGVALGSEDTTSPYSISWNTATATNGAHTISARARDAAGNTAVSAVVNLTVSNGSTGLIAAYGFEEGGGTTTADSSGRGHTGTVSGVTWVTTGRFGKALSFDGVNDLVNVADSNALDLTSAMTLEAWIRPTSATDYRSVVIKERSGGLVYSMYSSSDTPPPSGWVRIGTADYSVNGPGAIPTNTWTHIAVTFGGGSLRLYVNGTLVTTVSRTGSIATSTSPLRIGGNTIWGEYFSGLIDEVRIYNRALSATEIQTDMNTPVVGN